MKKLKSSIQFLSVFALSMTFWKSSKVEQYKSIQNSPEEGQQVADESQIIEEILKRADHERFSKEFEVFSTASFRNGG